MKRAQQDRSASLVMVSLVAGVTSGVVTATLVAVGLLRGGAGNQTAVPETLIPTEGRTFGDAEGMLEAIRELTAALDRAALLPPEQSRTALNAPSSSDGASSDLQETLHSVQEALEQLANRPAGGSLRPTAVINETLRVEGVRTHEMQAFATVYKDLGEEAAARTLLLRSIEYVVNRFGVPSEISPGSGLMHVYWRSDTAFLHVTFVDGYVARVEANWE